MRHALVLVSSLLITPRKLNASSNPRLVLLLLWLMGLMFSIPASQLHAPHPKHHSSFLKVFWFDAFDSLLLFLIFELEFFTTVFLICTTFFGLQIVNQLINVRRMTLCFDNLQLKNFENIIMKTQPWKIWKTETNWPSVGLTIFLFVI